MSSSTVGYSLVRVSKMHRALIIANHLADTPALYAGKAVCCTCGEAAEALRKHMVQVLELGPKGQLVPQRWLTPAQLGLLFPRYFDATCGHLPAWMMVEIAEFLREQWLTRYGKPDGSLTYLVPTGSGETIQCLRWAFPGLVFEPYDAGTSGTEQHPEAPLLKVAGAVSRPGPGVLSELGVEVVEL